MKKRISFSVIIPTLGEANNLPHLLKAFSDVGLDEYDFEVLVVDDNSQDGTVELMAKLQGIYPWARLLVRQGERSLSQSVIEGFNAALFPILISMDADLSHPVSSIPTMLRHLECDEIDMVIGSRYVEGGSVDEAWPVQRKLVSRFFGVVTKWLLRLSVNDPLSGFFAIKKSVFKRGNIEHAFGWKIALELMVRCPCKKTIEIPIHFSERRFGASKLNFKVGMAFARQIKQLIYFQITR